MSSSRREAEGPVDRAGRRNRPDLDPDRRARPARSVIGIDSSPAMLAQARASTRRRWRRARAREATCATFDARRGGRARHLPVPGAPPPADVGRSAPRLRAGRDRPEAGRSLRVERLRLRPRVRGRGWTGSDRTSRSAPHESLCARRQPRRHPARRRADTLLALVGDEAPSGKGSRRRGARDGGAVRLVRPRPVRRRRAASSSGSRASRCDFVRPRSRRIYDPWSRSVTEDVGFYVDQALASGGPVVELAVGTGRIAIPIARAGST